MVDLRSLSTPSAGLPNLPSAHTASSVVRLDSVADFVKFWHAAYGSPAVSTFLAAIDKSFIRVPGLTSAKVRRHPPDSLATAYGHLHATRKGFRSTKKSPSPAVPTIMWSQGHYHERNVCGFMCMKYVQVELIPMLLELCRREGVQGHFTKLSSTTKTPMLSTSRQPGAEVDQIYLPHCSEQSSSSPIAVLHRY